MIISLTAILGGVYLVMNDKSTAGLTSIITTVGALAGVFVYGKYTQKKELDRKR